MPKVHTIKIDHYYLLLFFYENDELIFTFKTLK